MTDYEVTPPPDRVADRVQLRTAFATERGEVTRIILQLEYGLEGDWREGVRDDHDRDAASGHDITEDSLHRDSSRGGENIRTEAVSPPIPANEGFDAAGEDLCDDFNEASDVMATPVVIDG